MDTSSTRKRRFRSVELKRQIVEETFEAGTSVAVIARRHGVNANQVFSWRRQYHRGELVAEARGERTPALLPVEVREVAVAAASSNRSADEESVMDGRIDIEFPGGRRLRVLGHADPELLGTVIRELSRP